MALFDRHFTESHRHSGAAAAIVLVLYQCDHNPKHSLFSRLLVSLIILMMMSVSTLMIAVAAAVAAVLQQTTTTTTAITNVAMSSSVGLCQCLSVFECLSVC